MKILLLMVIALYRWTPMRKMVKTFVHWTRIRRLTLGRNSFAVSSPLIAEVNYTKALEDIEQRIRRWNRFHPFGAVTTEDGHELEALKIERAGLKLAQCADLGAPFIYEEILDDTEGDDWRN